MFLGMTMIVILASVTLVSTLPRTGKEKQIDSIIPVPEKTDKDYHNDN